MDALEALPSSHFNFSFSFVSRLFIMESVFCLFSMVWQCNGWCSQIALPIDGVAKTCSSKHRQNEQRVHVSNLTLEARTKKGRVPTLREIVIFFSID